MTTLPRGTAWSILLVALLAGLGAAIYFWKDRPAAPDVPGKQASHAGFRDLAREAGITFHMDFLPGEQGEKFKVNLYDHGCGVAVADFDGDGFDDIYFVNQLGPNALYRNQGDGTFTDVTEQAGFGPEDHVGLGDRVCVGATFADYDNDGLPDLYVT